MIDQAALTLKRVRYAPNIRGSRFLEAYADLVRGVVPGDEELDHLLRLAVIFVSADDPPLRTLGYRIVLSYSEATGDYTPLRRVAQAKEIMPLLDLLDRIEPASDGLVDVVLESYRSAIADQVGGRRIHRTRWQHRLRTHSQDANDSVIVAPTSYGKSEMIVGRIAAGEAARAVILVPTKALIAQTRKNLLKDESIRASRLKVITHPEGYNLDDRFVAVMTQERAFRLMQENESLAFDLVLVDEAHNLLGSDKRWTLLAQVILSAMHRNSQAVVAYYTPFITDHESVQLSVTSRILSGIRADETVKVERLHFIDPSDSSLYLYDQFLDQEVLIGPAPSDEVDAVLALRTPKNVVYVNRPVHAEGFAKRLASQLPEVDDEALSAAAEAIADFVHPHYTLVDCIRHGVVFHHGKVPELIRQYVESIYSDALAAEFLCTTSTLLEGVNTPSEALFIASPKKGRGHMSKAAFRNLVGRVARFSEVFAPQRDSIALLQPPVYVLNGETAGARFNPRTFLKKVSDPVAEFKDEVENPLLRASTAAPEETSHEIEILVNVERDIEIDGFSVRRAQTDIGKYCFQANIQHFSILDYEDVLEANLHRYRSTLVPITSTSDLIHAIREIFWRGVDISKEEDVARVNDNRKAQSFYAAFADWRMQGMPFKRVLRRFLNYWRDEESDLVYVGSSWGDTSYTPEGPLLYVRLSEKTDAQRVTLAVAKAKEEQDFLDYKLLPYVEVLLKLELIDQSFYDRLVFGTSDAEMIVLLKNGVSWELARALLDDYREHVAIDIEQSMFSLDTAIPALLEADGANDILVYEATCNI